MPLNSVCFEFIICFATSLSIHEFTLNSFSFANSQSPLRIYNLLCEFTSNSVSFSRIHFEFFIFFLNSLWIHYFFRECPVNSLSIYNDSWWLMIFCNLVINSLWIHFEFLFFFANSLSNHNFFADSLWIHYLFRYFTLNSLFISRIHFELNIFKSNSSCLMISSSRINYQFTFYFANLLLIYFVSNSIIWLLLAKFDPIATSNDFLWTDLTSNYFQFQFPTKFLVETYVYWIYFD